MYNFNGFRPEISFFGACNSFDGFKSYFPQIFEPQKYKRIFILKGGPGTGKSSLMRSVGAYYSRLGLYTEAVYCSSDPSSLDGVIVKYRGLNIAILDGTSPHATEAKYPALIEKTTNLEESIDSSVLKSSYDRILELNKKKYDGYKSAYSALAVCGRLFRILDSELSVYGRNIAAEIAKTYNLSDQICSNNAKITPIRIESSFSKFGITFIKPNEDNKSVISLGPNPLLGGIVLGALYRDYLYNDKDLIVCPSPLSPDLIDRIYTSDYIFDISLDSNPTIDIEPLFPHTERIFEVLECYNRVLNLAQASLSYASQMHFALEDIYKRSMDFENNERIYEKIIEEINILLSI